MGSGPSARSFIASLVRSALWRAPDAENIAHGAHSTTAVRAEFKIPSYTEQTTVGIHVINHDSMLSLGSRAAGHPRSLNDRLSSGTLELA